VRRLLSGPEPAECSRSEAAFEDLQAQARPVAEYGYDPLSTWKRGATRAAVLLGLSSGLTVPGARILEAACGDGMTGYLLAGFGHRVCLADTDEWRDTRARGIDFLACDLTLPGVLPGDQFDLVYSYNSFEHFDDPAAVLRNLVGACRPGGLLYFEFGPLYCGPWGLHAYRTLRMPYPQFLFSPEFINRQLERLGIEDLGGKRTSLQPLNRWRLSQFRDLWNSSGCEVMRCDVGWVDTSNLRVVTQFPEAFRGRGLAVEDLLAQSITVLLRKPEGGRA
jgi:SAM-dependent methyltransferase